MKIAVYSIALNEAKHVERWAGSAAAAEYRLVGDTGSTDGTPEMLRASGVEVHDIRIRPWRFDDARNAALSLLPADADICVSLDLDRFLLPDWRGAVESAWKDDVDRLYHRYSVRFDEAGKTLWTTRGSCIHARFGYRWFRRVHEDVRKLGGEERPAWVEQDIIGHLPDREKPRNYLPLLEEEHRDNPEDPLILYNLARDLLFDRQHEKSLQGFKQYLQLPRAKWPAERSQAMIYLAKLDQKNQTEWLLRAHAEAPTRREVCFCLAERYLQLSDWAGVFWAARSGLANAVRTGSHLDVEYAWGPRLGELAALAGERLGLTPGAGG